ncbi:MAG: hypothetical protein HY508_07615, partial [Acidobacteria bacterium]|nr:hypothetical protein [Acidobacteriota bacterium]
KMRISAIDVREVSEAERREFRLGLIKSTAHLVNVARGTLVDPVSLYRNLAKGRVAGAGLDVFESEPPDPQDHIFMLPNVAAMPHIGGGTDASSRRCGQCATANIERVAQSLEPPYQLRRRATAIRWCASTLTASSGDAIR